MSYTELSCKDVKGKKEYRCSWCGQKILTGELHQSRAYIADDGFSTSREHLECAEAMDKFDWDNNDSEYMFGEFMRGSIEYR